MLAPWPCSAETLAFVMPGLVHRLGNALFTVQGHAQIPDRVIPREPILAATHRGGRALAAVRALLGPVVEPPADPVELLDVLLELARIPFREAGHALELAAAGCDELAVDPGTFSPAIVGALHAFAELLPRGQGGTLRVTLAGRGDTVVVALRYVPAPGELPFAPALPELGQTLRARLAGLHRAPRLAVAGPTLELAFGGTAPAEAAQA